LFEIVVTELRRLYTKSSFFFRFSFPPSDLALLPVNRYTVVPPPSQFFSGRERHPFLFLVPTPPLCSLLGVPLRGTNPWADKNQPLSSIQVTLLPLSMIFSQQMYLFAGEQDMASVLLTFTLVLSCLCFLAFSMFCL